MTPEGQVKKGVDVASKCATAYTHKPVQNGMGEPALDYHGCHRGFYFGVETKALGKSPTERQQRTMRRIKAAGGSVFLIDSLDGTDYAQFMGWLLNPVPGFISETARRFM